MPAKRNVKSEFGEKLRLLAGTRTSEEAVVYFVEQKLARLSNPKPPIDLPMMASCCGIMPEINAVEMNQDGRLICKDEKFYIQVNQAHPMRKQRFATAHEINHKILSIAHNHQLRWDCSGIGKPLQKIEEERLCDYGARHLLLLTPKFLTPIIGDLGLTVAGIHEVTQKFLVSFEAAARAIVETANTPIAVIYCGLRFTKDEMALSQQLPLFHHSNVQPKLRIVRAYKSKSFPVALPNNKSISENSCIINAFDKGERCTSREIHCFDSKHSYAFDVEAIGKPIYVEEKPEDGAIIILSNPSLQVFP